MGKISRLGELRLDESIDGLRCLLCPGTIISASLLQLLEIGQFG